ncbi:TIGR03617 family F420-dependent LLM class oxidoreductase [Microbacterium sp. NPDC056044]|uniref:TIGR03617 family F420-dependent LLM class oxidoreductase n=1 Tax=Microbacterium sp. NPDC056044 TaxID=3345690 RepID=UPI0035DBFEB6
MTEVFLSIDPAPDRDAARVAEGAGFDGVAVAELAHDPIVSIAAAAARTERVTLATAALVAFGRSPMTVAMQAADVQALSGGRFVLGLGTQIKPHVELRYSMPWSAPAPRMREFVRALRAIWDSYATGARLAVRGEHYRHTLLPPAFVPERFAHGAPPVWIAGFGERMTAVAGEVGDGFLAHPFASARFLREVSLPALEVGRRRGPVRDGFRVIASPLVGVGVTADEIGIARDAVRRQLAFYGSTPAYSSALELHGWGELGDLLNAKSRRGDWDAMTALVTDDVLDEFAAVGTPADVAKALRARYDSDVDALCLQLPAPPTAAALHELRAALG